ncbi:DUF5602 domain-containing protein [Flavilitoribacter nigricans]|uniref:TTHB210-like domain-containing protein n=1 Tax=Flavilitoribacter nigricans (strain ATCC 23147 / DSM 23189 / NBRC 102662 / NCIMB 1420 / SS-2) TaxID=1122177 RepID=A0A2D0N9K6_FLAN2|nr:DUF5602 domain-containing protein [Flavilitoribacter nigricans]PHN05165.1 hypothetical protein CRP01_16730 [Flavilitoribacter nigricans DSM 23189 = NBRC 102662]
MKSILKISVLTCLVINLFLFPSCKEEDPGQADLSGTVYSDPQSLGNGEVRSYVTKDESGTPVSIGIEFNEAALENLPTGHAHGYSLLFELPEAVPPFNHISFDWNEHGHEPPGVYDVPHFDLHFYFMELEARMAIAAGDTVQFANQPDAAYMPAAYIQLPGGVPAMGSHWIDPATPELHGTPFTYTMIYGSFDGKLTFIEPMFALSYLQQKVTEHIDIPQPASYQLGGYFPMTYGFHYRADNGTYTISLDELVDRD